VQVLKDTSDAKAGDATHPLRARAIQRLSALVSISQQIPAQWFIDGNDDIELDDPIFSGCSSDVFRALMTIESRECVVAVKSPRISRFDICHGYFGAASAASAANVRFRRPETLLRSN
jgi:hypothetical protein